MKAPRPSQLCACGDHAFAGTSRWGVVLVSPQDRRLLDSGCWTINIQNRTAYALRNLRPAIKLHHAVLGRRVYTDHENGNGLDCRRDNIRPTTHGKNMRNARTRRDNAAGYRGVGFHKACNRYRARIQTDGARLELGSFDDARSAAVAYDAAAKKYHGDFARLNFPEASANG